MKLEAPDQWKLRWWGNREVAHYVPTLSEMKTACGRTLMYGGKDFTRLNPETGEPWPKCERCLARRPAPIRSTGR